MIVQVNAIELAALLAKADMTERSSNETTYLEDQDFFQKKYDYYMEMITNNSINPPNPVMCYNCHWEGDIDDCEYIEAELCTSGVDKYICSKCNEAVYPTKTT